MQLDELTHEENKISDTNPELGQHITSIIELMKQELKEIVIRRVQN